MKQFEPKELEPENDPPSKSKRPKPRKLTLATLIIVMLAILAGVAYSMYQFNNWSKQWELKFQSPIQNFIRIEPRASLGKAPHTIATHTIVREAKASEPVKVKPEAMSTEEYIKHVFGKDARMALAVSQAENGTRQCDRVTNEPNNTVSVGLFQINTVHFKKYPLKQLITCQGNIDAAKQIYDSWGSWSAWSVYKNGSYKKFLQ